MPSTTGGQVIMAQRFVCIPAHSVTACKHLRRLNLNGLKLLTDGTLGAIAQSLEHLVELEMKECRLITNQGLSYLAQGSTHMLQVFNFEFCTRISDDGVAFLCALVARRKESKAGAPVRIFNLGHLPLLTSKSLALIAEHAADDLNSLNIAQCARVDEDSVIVVLNSCRSLKVINIKELPLLTDRLLDEIIEHNCYALEKLLITTDTFSEASLVRLMSEKRPSMILNVAVAMKLPYVASSKADAELDQSQ